MKVINCIALTLVVIGAINWGLVGLFNFNLVTFIFAKAAIVSRIIFTLVGIAGLWSLTFFSRLCGEE